jgi:hypothetical protein
MQIGLRLISVQKSTRQHMSAPAGADFSFIKDVKQKDIFYV